MDLKSQMVTLRPRGLPGDVFISHGPSAAMIWPEKRGHPHMCSAMLFPRKGLKQPRYEGIIRSVAGRVKPNRVICPNRRESRFELFLTATVRSRPRWIIFHRPEGHAQDEKNRDRADHFAQQGRKALLRLPLRLRNIRRG